MSKCAEWLKDFIGTDGCEYQFVKEHAFEEGFTKKELKEARRELGVKTRHLTDEDVENWFWYLPHGCVSGNGGCRENES